MNLENLNYTINATLTNEEYTHLMSLLVVEEKIANLELNTTGIRKQKSIKELQKLKEMSKMCESIRKKIGDSSKTISK